MVRCVNCWKLVYPQTLKREPILENGVIESLQYESAPGSLREAISLRDDAKLLERLNGIQAFNGEMDCFVRVIIDQAEKRWEPRYLRAENESSLNYASRILSVAREERTCPHFSQYIGGLKVVDYVNLQGKAELDVKTAYLKQLILTNKLRELRSRFLNLESLSAQNRGYEFQHLLNDLFEAYELNPKENVIVPGEQIDIVLSMNHFTSVLVEAKWESVPIEASDVRNFYGKLESRSPRIIGLIISMSGFTEGAETEVRSKLQKRTIVTMNRQEVESIINGQIDFRSLFGEKLRRAEELGSK